MSKVLFADPIPPAAIAALSQALPAGADLDGVTAPDNAEFARRAADAEVLLVIHRRIDAAVLALAPRVRFIQRCGVGYDNLDLAAIAAAGAQVAYTPGVNAEAVAEHTILLMLALLKRLPTADQGTRQGHWPFPALLEAGLDDLATATVGLVGLGQIGQAVAARLSAFGSRVLYTARHHVAASREEQLQVRYASLAELLAGATIVSLHVPLTSETRRLIGAPELAQMRAGALLINTARGDVVDEVALRRALETGHLGGAGLDVLVHEAPGGNPFADLIQVVVTPHVAGASRAGVARITQMALANVARFLAGETPHDLLPDH